MSSPFPIVLERPRALALPYEIALARLALRATPDSAKARSRLCALLVRSDLFDEALGLFEDGAPLHFADAINLAHALLALETPEGNARVNAMALKAEALAEEDFQLAMALAIQGKAQLRLKNDEGAELLRAALRLDPHNADACKRLVRFYIDHARPDAAIALVDGLAAHGVGHSRMQTARTLALAQQGDVAGARASVGMDAFLFQETLDPPDGWSSIAAFNDALAAQLLAHPALRYERYGSASEQSWRVDDPLSHDAPLVEVALDHIRKVVGRHLATLTGIDHPWLRAKPDRGTLHSWSVIAESAGYETWHVHQFGWLSGVYYVQVPDAIRNGSGEGGCLAWGVPEDVVGDAAAQAYGVRMARPEPGMLLLFPSHAYHRTFPHGAAERRIVLAFDLWPH